MTKSELKTGLIATLRNGDKYYVLIDSSERLNGSRDVLVSVDGTHKLISISNYSNDLTVMVGWEFDIMKLEALKTIADMFDLTPLTTVVYQREEPKEMTIEDIQKALGYKIKIIENKKEEEWN